MPPRLPPLNSLRVFEAAARHASFARAAYELHLTHGAISRQIRQLEVQLGLALFERRNRAVFLTAAGEQLHAACSEALGKLQQTLARLQADSNPPPLVLSCEPTLAMRWLIPRLPAFHARHPDIALHLLTAGGAVDFARDRVDLALRRNDFAWPADGHLAELAAEYTGPVCPPAQAAAVIAGSPQTWLHTRSRDKAWPQWQARSGYALPCAGHSTLEHFYLSLQAAGAGLGLAIGSVFMVADELAATRLAAPLGFVADGSAYVLLSPQAFDGDRRRSAVLAWLRQEMATTLQQNGLAAG